jgi:hypothetical protein
VLIFVGILIVLGLLVGLLKYTADSKVLNIINLAEKVVQSGKFRKVKRRCN